MDILVFSDSWLRWSGGAIRCVVGRGGIVPEVLKHEGDGATPAGCWPLRRVLYRSDRLLPPVTALPLAALAPNDGWCDDPGHDAYNQLVKRPFLANYEPLWRTDALYDVIVVLGYNDSCPRPGRGSAIFLHCATPTYDPTAGCIAVVRSDLLHLLASCREGDRLCLNRENLNQSSC